MTRTFRCVSCNTIVTEPMVVNGLRLCESCSDELAATKTSMEGQRQPPLKPPRLRVVRDD